MKKLLLTAALAVLVLFPVQVRAGALKVVMVDSGVTGLPLSYAIKEGCLAAAGVKAEIVPVVSGATSVMIAGQADASVSSLAPILAAYQHGADVKVIAFLYNRPDYYAVSRYPAAEAAKIKSVGVNSAGIGGLDAIKPFTSYLKLDLGKLKRVVAKGDAVKYAMLEMGYVDLFTVWSQELARKVAAEKKYTLLPDPDQGRSMGVLAVTVTGKTLKKKGPELAKFMAGLYCAIKDSAADGKKTGALLVSEYAYTEGEAAAYFEKRAGLVKDFDFVPSAAEVARNWEYIDGVKPEERRDLSGLVYPALAIQAAKDYSGKK